MCNIFCQLYTYQNVTVNEILSCKFVSNVLVILRSALKYCKVIFVLSAISFLEIDRTHFQRLVRGGMLIFYC